MKRIKRKCAIHGCGKPVHGTKDSDARLCYEHSKMLGVIK